MTAGERIGVTGETIRRWERGDPPAQVHWPKLARYLGTTTDEVGKLVRAQRYAETTAGRLDRYESALRDVQKDVAVIKALLETWTPNWPGRPR